MSTERVEFIDIVDALSVTSDIARNYGGFLTGGYAIGLHVGNLDYRWHSDIDIICPRENEKALYYEVVTKMISHPVYFYYENGNTVFLALRKKRKKNLVELHMTGFSNDGENYCFPFELKIPTDLKLSEEVERFGKSFNVASTGVLRQSKIHALKLGYLYPSKETYYEEDLRTLRGL